jgi:hypothetical protein
VLHTEAEDENLVAVSEGGQCLKCIGFFSLMILLPALVFIFIHLGNNDWKFKFGKQDKNAITFEDINIPSVSKCTGEILFNNYVSDVFKGEYK